MTLLQFSQRVLISEQNQREVKRQVVLDYAEKNLEEIVAVFNSNFNYLALDVKECKPTVISHEGFLYAGFIYDGYQWWITKTHIGIKSLDLTRSAFCVELGNCVKNRSQRTYNFMRWLNGA